MHRVVTAESRPQLVGGQYPDHRQMRRQRADLANTLLGPIEGCENHGATARFQFGADLVIARHHLARPARQTQNIQAAAPQQTFQTLGQIGRHFELPAGGFGKIGLRHCGIYHIPLRAQPHSPSGQPPLYIGDQLARGSDDEADQRFLRSYGAGDDAAALRTFFVVGFRQNQAPSPSNQWARAAMITALASSGVKVSLPSISISSSPARSPRSSRVLTPFSPSVTSMVELMPSMAASSSVTPSSRRRSSLRWSSSSSAVRA